MLELISTGSGNTAQRNEDETNYRRRDPEVRLDSQNSAIFLSELS